MFCYSANASGKEFVDVLENNWIWLETANLESAFLTFYF